MSFVINLKNTEIRYLPALAVCVLHTTFIILLVKTTAFIRNLGVTDPHGPLRVRG
jgi:hypothetical protein